MADRHSDGGRRLSPMSPLWRRVTLTVHLVGATCMVTVYQASLDHLSWIIARRARMIGIPINAHIVKAIFFFPSLWVLPKIFLHLLAWYINFSFLHHLLIMRRFRISGLKRYMAEHIKDIALKGTFFSRHSSSTPREFFSFSVLLCVSSSFCLLVFCCFCF